MDFEYGGKTYNIELLRSQLSSLRANRLTFAIVGSAMLSVGLTLFIVALVVLLSGVVEPNAATFALWVVLGISFGWVLIIVGISFLIVQAAAFAKRISNRVQIISTYESNNR